MTDWSRDISILPMTSSNLSISTVDSSALENNSRLDAEFYHPHLLDLRERLRPVSKPLGAFAKYIKRGTQPQYSEEGTIPAIRSVNVRETGLNETRQEMVEETFYDSKKAGQVRK